MKNKIINKTKFSQKQHDLGYERKAAHLHNRIFTPVDHNP
jgi:hypothetical protein